MKNILSYKTSTDLVIIKIAMEFICEIEWYKIYRGDKIQTPILVDGNWNKFEIKLDDYAIKLWSASKYPTRLEMEKALVDLLPKELPYNVREFLVFQY